MKNISNRKFDNVLFFAIKKFFMPKILFLIVGGMVYAQTSVTSVMSLDASGIVDQDDMCIWIHPTNKSQSTIIASDKGANKLFVYDLDGNTLQTIDVPGMPGNIDIRYNFDLNGELTDFIGYNDRSSSTLRFYKINKDTRDLSYISSFSSGSNYGFCLYRSFITGKYFAFSSNSSSDIKQYELYDNSGTIEGTYIRTLDNGSGNTEGMVCDDEGGTLYAGNESDGIYKYTAEPSGPSTGTLIAATGTNGFSADVEGLTLYYMSDGEGYLIASSQGNSRFYVFNRKPPHDYVNYFTVVGVGSTDGIDVTNVSLNSTFQAGIFLCHDGTGSPYVIRVCQYEDLGLLIDSTYWDPRNNNVVTSILNDLQKPKQFFLTQNYPNPFNPTTNINYSIPESEVVSLKIFNSIGEEVSTLVNAEKVAGSYSVEFNATGLPSGVYFYRLQAGNFIDTKKIALIK